MGSGGPGGGGAGVQGHGGGGQGGGQAAKLPGGGHGASSPDSPVSDVNSILAGAHLQVSKGLFNTLNSPSFHQAENTHVLFTPHAMDVIFHSIPQRDKRLQCKTGNSWGH